MDCTDTSAVRRPQTSTPALEALLPSQRSTPPLPLPASYNPTSLPALLTRLSSFKLTTFPSRPSPLSFALVGWTNSARNTLRCETCEASFTVAVGSKVVHDIEAWEVKSRENHKLGCAWRVRGCSKSLYSVPKAGRTALLAQLVPSTTAPPSLEVISLVVPPSTTTEQLQTAGLQNAGILRLFGWESEVGGTVACAMCMRKILLDAYVKGGKEFDVLAQHRDFCAYLGAWEGRVDVVLRRDSGIRRMSGDGAAEKVSRAIAVLRTSRKLTNCRQLEMKHARAYVRELLGGK
jgi:hypothetical protein